MMSPYGGMGMNPYGSSMGLGMMNPYGSMGGFGMNPYGMGGFGMPFGKK